MYLSVLEVECNVCCGAVGGTHGTCCQGEGVTNYVGDVQCADCFGFSNSCSHTHQRISQSGFISTWCTAPAGEYIMLPTHATSCTFASLVACFAIRSLFYPFDCLATISNISFIIFTVLAARITTRHITRVSILIIKI